MAYSILIVDDSATTRAMIKRAILLAQVPTEGILEAGDGAEALAKLCSHEADIVFADLNMPNMTGLELTRAIREGRAGDAHKQTPIVIVSSESMESKVELLKSEGADSYIKKPFTPEQIRDVVGQVLGVCNA